MTPTNYETVTGLQKKDKPKVSAENPDDVLIVRLMAALRAKPFAILAGHSGTGKSRMVRKLAYMTCRPYKELREKDGKALDTPGNFCMVQVKPNWHDSLDLLGYYSENKSEYRTTDFVRFICKAYAYPDVPFFVCLDEMNLAPVEQYFAEFLSAIESRKIAHCELRNAAGQVTKSFDGVVTDELVDSKVWVSAEKLGCEKEESLSWLKQHGLTIPRNLFVVGTVNMDESTNQFSRKVLDRAFTLEMNDADFSHFGIKDKEPSFDDYIGEVDEMKFATDAVSKLLDGEVKAEKLIANPEEGKPFLADHQVEKLNALKKILRDTSFVVAYRFANEYALYENALAVALTDVFDNTTTAPADNPPADHAAAGGEAVVAEEPKAKPDPDVKVQAFDDMVLMKLLPRIADEYGRVKELFHGGEDITKDPEDGSLLRLFPSATSGARVKMLEMLNRKQPFVTFWP